MANYIDLVLVDDAKNRVVCKAPWLSHLEKGMQVRYSVNGRSYNGHVAALMEGIDREDEDCINFALTSLKQEELGKVISKMKVIDFDYEDEEDE